MIQKFYTESWTVPLWFPPPGRELMCLLMAPPPRARAGPPTLFAALVCEWAAAGLVRALWGPGNGFYYQVSTCWACPLRCCFGALRRVAGEVLRWGSISCAPVGWGHCIIARAGAAPLRQCCPRTVRSRQ